MIKIPFSLLLLIGTMSASNAQSSFSLSHSLQSQAQMQHSEKVQIEQVLLAYGAALNASDVSAAVAAYAPDGIFMPTEAPTAAGQAELEASYTHIFSMIRLHITFFFDEIVVQGDLAYARTVSRGEVTILAQGITVPEENRELFVLKKVDGHWKIASYMFNKMSPPAR
jgi:uncharacterized protein (TIGR02246 family)